MEMLFQLQALFGVNSLTVTLLQPYGDGLAMANFTFNTKRGVRGLASELEEMGIDNFTSPDPRYRPNSLTVKGTNISFSFYHITVIMLYLNFSY